MLKVPLKRAEIFHTAKTTSDDFMSTAAKPASTSGPTTCAYRVTIILESTNAVLNLRVYDGTNTIVGAMNGGTALTAGVTYTFSFGASASATYNFRIGTNTTVGYFLLEEIQTAVI